MRTWMPMVALALLLLGCAPRQEEFAPEDPEGREVTMEVGRDAGTTDGGRVLEPGQESATGEIPLSQAEEALGRVDGGADPEPLIRKARATLAELDRRAEQGLLEPVGLQARDELRDRLENLEEADATGLEAGTGEVIRALERVAVATDIEIELGETKDPY